MKNNKTKQSKLQETKYIPINEIHRIIETTITRLTAQQITPADAISILKNLLTYHQNG